MFLNFPIWPPASKGGCAGGCAGVVGGGCAGILEPRGSYRQFASLVVWRRPGLAAHRQKSQDPVTILNIYVYIYMNIYIYKYIPIYSHIFQHSHTHIYIHVYQHVCLKIHENSQNSTKNNNKRWNSMKINEHR
jgi:hypothetical protein